jgi:hypothetical protein
VRVLKASDVRLWEKLFGYACLAGAAATNDNANLPITILYRQRTRKPLL